ncbi:MAG: SagB/ThcOx family dehydrogenase [Acidobacteriota bacterium]|nr:SagB/ThcOx family dehydrogenase [Acidobacteriota bacterium]
MRRMAFLSILVMATLAVPVAGQTSKAAPGSEISLPAPDTAGGMTLNQALATRRSVRAFTEQPLTEGQVSQLLWAAQGITSPRGQRTAPSAHAQYFLHVYVARAGGFYEYLPAGHKLKLVSTADLRAKLTSDKAPEVFLIAGDYARAEAKFPAAQADRFVNLEAGHAAQNLVLEATSLGLSGVTVGGLNPKEAAETAGLPEGILPMYAIPVGHAAKQ